MLEFCVWCYYCFDMCLVEMCDGGIYLYYWYVGCLCCLDSCNGEGDCSYRGWDMK